MTLINPTPEPKVRQVDSSGAFHRTVMRNTHEFEFGAAGSLVGACKHCGAERGTPRETQRCPDADRLPDVTIVVQIRGKVRSVNEVRAMVARSLAQMRRRGVPEDEQTPLLGRAIEEKDSRGWTDVETWYEGEYDLDRMTYPPAQRLEQLEEIYGAAESRVSMRVVT